MQVLDGNVDPRGEALSKQQQLAAKLAAAAEAERLIEEDKAKKLKVHTLLLNDIFNSTISSSAAADTGEYSKQFGKILFLRDAAASLIACFEYSMNHHCCSLSALCRYAKVTFTAQHTHDRHTLCMSCLLLLCVCSSQPKGKKVKEAEKVLEETSASVVGADLSAEEAKVDAMLTMATGSATGDTAGAAGTVDANTIANRGFTAPPAVDSDEDVQHFDVNTVPLLH
jgi:hypothetical protein